MPRQPLQQRVDLVLGTVQRDQRDIGTDCGDSGVNRQQIDPWVVLRQRFGVIQRAVAQGDEAVLGAVAAQSAHQPLAELRAQRRGFEHHQPLVGRQQFERHGVLGQPGVGQGVPTAFADGRLDQPRQAGASRPSEVTSRRASSQSVRCRPKRPMLWVSAA
ncbi:hypothetical protein CUR86_10980 [Salinicola acroporae]|uniref:Uncharacterized protein n=1 Tax=Salinicola acroporae TaxID=1541440 RepID=A0ABT6I6P7_9GAMM|nr:hypothetical protein [Salinicola acroporae]